MNLLVYLQFFILYLLNLNLTDVLANDCFQCVSTNKTDMIGCRTPFNQWNIPYVKNCKQHIAGQSNEAFACVKILEAIEEVGQPGILQERIIRDCISVPMKAGCEKRQMSNLKLAKKNVNGQVIITQCVFLCADDGCNASSSIQLTNLIGLISLIVFLKNFLIIVQ